MLQNRHATRAGNHEVNDHTNRRVVTQRDCLITRLSKLGFVPGLLEVVGNDSLDGIIRLNQ